jgi:hypothetical protein
MTKLMKSSGFIAPALIWMRANQTSATMVTDPKNSMRGDAIACCAT